MITKIAIKRHKYKKVIKPIFYIYIYNCIIRNQQIDNRILQLDY